MYSYFLTLLLCVISSLGPVLADRLIDLEQTTLANGLRLIVIEDHRLPRVSFQMWLKAGSADDPVGKSGLAHITEHAILQFGTKLFPSYGKKGELTRKIAALGGEESAETTCDWTRFFIFINKERLESVFDLYAQRMRDLEFHQGLFDSEKKVVLEERLMFSDDVPKQKLSEITTRMLYFHHPYGVPVIGWRHEIETLTLEDLRAYYERWYHPDNAVIIIEGDTTLEESRALAEKYFVPIPPASHSLEHLWTSLPPRHNVGVRTMLEEVGLKLSVKWTYLTEGANKSYQKALARTLLALILGDKDYGRLPRLMLGESKLGSNAGAAYTPDRRGPASFSIFALPREKQDITFLEALINSALKEMMVKGPSEEELEVARRVAETNIIFSLDTFGTISEFIGESLMTEQGLEEMQKTLTLFRAITIEEIREVAQELFSRSPDIQVVSLPASQSKE